jgi:hypothetical protein
MAELTGQQVYDKIDLGNPIDRDVSQFEKDILNDLLLFDKEQNASTNTGYYKDWETQTDWTLKLSRITESDIKKYVKDVNSRDDNPNNNISEFQIRSIYDEALRVTLADNNNSLASNGLFSINAVTGFFIALQDNNYSDDAITIANIKQAVTAFDKYDGKGVNKVTARDLNDFANAYRLSDPQRAKLVSFYSNIAEIEVRNGDDKIIEIP